MPPPIEQIPNTRPPQFRWSQKVDGYGGARTIEHQGVLPPNLEQVVSDLVTLVSQLQREVAVLVRARDAAVDQTVLVQQLETERDKLQAFKDWVHGYLDVHQVPHHPPGVHGAAGCRIGDRMDWLMAELASAQSSLSEREDRWQTAVGMPLERAEEQARAEVDSATQGSSSRRGRGGR